MVVTSEMVACDGQEERQKLVVADGHDGASDVEEKLLVMRGMMVVLSGSCP